MAGRGISSSNNLVIDLTQSDDEDSSQVYPSTAAAGSHTPYSAQPPGFLSYDGLPGCESSTKPTKHFDQNNPYVILPQHARQLDGFQSQLTTFGGHSTQFRRSTGQASSSPISAATNISDTQVVQSEHPAKRRKPNSGSFPQRPRAILPPTPQYKQATQSTQPVQTVRRADLATQAKTIISGASRAGLCEAPQLSLEGGAQTARLSMRAVTEAEECLQNQVIPHIKKSLRQYQNSLPAETRSAIGIKVVKQLIGDRAFYDDFNNNEQRLSQEYETNLAKTAQAYVNRYVTEVLEGSQFDVASSKSQTFADTPKRTRQPATSLMSDPLQSNIKDDLYSSDEEPIFEKNYSRTPVASHAVTNLRSYSSSPTTSFSNDQTEDEKNGGSNVHEAKSNNEIDTPRLRRSIRAATSSRLLPKARPVPPKRLKPPAKPQSKTKRSSKFHSNNAAVKLKQSDITTVRQVRSLHLAARDTSILRPYLSSLDRYGKIKSLTLSNKHICSFLSPNQWQVLDLPFCHVDFCLEEIKILCVVIRNARGDPASNVVLGTELYRTVVSLMAGQESVISKIQRDLQKAITQSMGDSEDKGIVLLRQRDQAAVERFLQDAAAGRIDPGRKAFHLEKRPMERRSRDRPPARTRSRLSSLLLQREIHGSTPYRIRRGQEMFKSMFTSSLEDSLSRHSEFTDCSGDVTTICWVSKTAFICGATAHSDFHNMQYNKPGNLALGSTSLDTLRAVSNHRIVRPVVTESENGENSLESMQQTQDPWLYTSVVSTAYNEKSEFAFTASFDTTVKVWKVVEDGSKMDLCGAWYHSGKVNFVVTSEHHNRVATTADITHDAVRVYSLDDSDVSNSSYDAYGGNRAQEHGVELSSRETWAYFPATIQWGKAYSVSHLLLVGYSPRSLTSHEVDIPEDKRNTGELCLWNTLDRSWVNISAAKTRNVFEVIWHPSQPIFLCATSPSGNHEPMKTKTQIRVFAQHKDGTFISTRILDCPAMDINELTIMPNSSIESYVTASCTDGNTYVYDTALYDTAQGEQPIHILRHGESLDNPIHDLPREMADSGVKFAAWGQSKTRFYTGASDGKVKVWDITAPPKEAFIRDVLCASGGISAGEFSKDFSQLVIGDATGKVHLLKTDDSDLDETPAKQFPIPMQSRHMLHRGGLLPSNIKRPKVLIPHPEPAPPMGVNYGSKSEQTGKDLAEAYIEEGMIEIHNNRLIGAIQGANYTETGFYCLEAHEGQDGSQPLLPAWQAKQQEVLLRAISHSQTTTYQPIVPPVVRNSDPVAHQKNVALEFDFSKLSLSTQEELRRDRVDLDWDIGHYFAYELSPGKKFPGFKEDKASKLERRKQKRWEAMVSLAGGSGGKG